MTPEIGGPPATPALLRGLSPDEQREALSRGNSRRLVKGQVLFEQAAAAEALCLVEAGRLKLTQVTAAGQTVTVRFTGPGELCAAIAVLDGKSYPFSAAAVEPSRVRLWTRPVLRELFRKWPRLETNLIEVVGTHSREMLDRFRELATEPVPQRVARALLRLARQGGRPGPEGILIERVTQQDLAELTATTIYTVNRVLSEWVAQDILRKGRARLLIRSEKGLAEIAEATEATKPRRP
jgi:CRP-like cAMP-binding protein